jgi:hypothetical protein
MTKLDGTPFTLSAITTNPATDAPAAVGSYSSPCRMAITPSLPP